MNVTNGIDETWSSLLEIGKSHPPLTADEERKMTEAYFTTDHEKWKEIMILHNIRFAIANSDRYFVRGEDRVDIVGRLIQGLAEAANRFDPGKGVRFLTFAGFYMKDAMRDAVDANLTAVRTNNATLAIMDKRVDGNDRESAATVADFVGNFTSPDVEQIDPSSEEKRIVSENSLHEIVDHFCSILSALPGNDRRRKSVISAFRVYFTEGITLEKTAERIGSKGDTVKDHVRCAIAFLKDSIRRGRLTAREWKSFVCDDTVKMAVADIDESEKLFENHEIVETREIVATCCSDTCRKGVKSFSDEGFYSGTNDSVLISSGQKIEAIAPDKITATNPGNNVYARIALFKVDGRRRNRNGVWHSRPFYGNFYSEWSRMQMMKSVSRTD